MSEKGKSRPTGGTAEAGQAETAARQAVISHSYSSIGGPERQPLRVSDVLCRGQKNGQTMRELRKFLNGDSRSIRLQIERERRSGCPIMSDCRHGYWLAETQAEIDAFVRSMRARAFEIQRTAALVQMAALETGNDS